MSFKNLDEQELEKFVGSVVCKVSGKPFKSKLKTGIVSKITINPYTNKLAFLMKDDESVVDARACQLFEETKSEP